jgi:hypothetical protein
MQPLSHHIYSHFRGFQTLFLGNRQRVRAAAANGAVQARVEAAFKSVFSLKILGLPKTFH